MLVFDVGANIGTKAEAMRAKGARLVCFEPQPHCAAKIRQRFSNDPDVTIVEQALGRAAGSARMAICDSVSAISTLSEEWKTGRFKNKNWDREIDVQVETLDSAIGRFGIPDYCKIDVEGFELDVLLGLNQALPLVSFEFTKEFEHRAIECIRRLQSVGFTAFNLSYGETHRFKLSQWIDPDSLVEELRKVRHPLAWGDIFAARERPTYEVLNLLPGPYTSFAQGDTLDALRRAGVAYRLRDLRLHLDCGENILPGYINIDSPKIGEISSRLSVDFQANISGLSFPDEAVQEIRLHHVLQRFSRVTALGMLIRWQRWLRPGGKLTIETHDFVSTAAEALRESGGARVALVRHLEGEQTSDHTYNITQWYPERLEHTLARFGFENIKLEKASSARRHNVTARAVKMNNISLDNLIARADELLFDIAGGETNKQTWITWCSQLRWFIDKRAMS